MRENGPRKTWTGAAEVLRYILRDEPFSEQRFRFASERLQSLTPAMLVTECRPHAWLARLLAPTSPDAPNRED